MKGRRPWYQQLFHAFLTPFNGVLFAVSVIFPPRMSSLPILTDRSFRTIIVPRTMILLSTLLRFWQEFRSNQAAESKVMVTLHRRRAAHREWIGHRSCRSTISFWGDIVYLSAGDTGSGGCEAHRDKGSVRQPGTRPEN